MNETDKENENNVDKDIYKRNNTNLKDFQIEKELSTSNDYIKIYKVLRKIDNKHYILLKYPLDIITDNINNFQKLEKILENIKILLKKVNHINILNIKESFIEKPKSSVIMILELYDNMTIQNSIINKYKLMRDRFIPENLLLDYLYNIIEALSVLHKNNIFNINLSPHNIYIYDNKIKLNPYISLETLSSLKISNNTYFKIKAPELLKNCNNYTKKTDIWYLGLLIYEISQLKNINKDYFDDENNNNIYNNIIKCNYPLNSYYSNDIKELIKLCLQYSQHKRPSASELLKIIDIYRQNRILNKKINSSKKSSKLKRKLNLKDEINKINYTLAKIKNYDNTKQYRLHRELTPVITRKNSNYFKVNAKNVLFRNNDINNKKFERPKLKLKTSFIDNFNNINNINNIINKKTGKKFFGIHKNNETLKGYLKTKPFDIKNFISKNPYFFNYDKNKIHNNVVKIKRKSLILFNSYEDNSVKKDINYRKINHYIIKENNCNHCMKNYKRANSVNYYKINKNIINGENISDKYKKNNNNNNITLFKYNKKISDSFYLPYKKTN